MSTKFHWNKMYNRPVETIPWEIERPPKELVNLILSGQIKPGKALDVACGTGNYSIYLANKMFDVVGVDYSKVAVSQAKLKAKKAGAKIKFLVYDVNLLGKKLKTKFDFILDYSLLHHIPDSKIKNYARQFYKLLKPGGLLLLVCYNERDLYAKDKKQAIGKYGNVMYYRSAAEITNYYQDLKLIKYRRCRLGKRQQHLAHGFLFKKI